MDRYHEILLERMIAEQQRTNDLLTELLGTPEEMEELPEFTTADKVDQEPVPVDELPEPPEAPKAIEIKRK